MASLVYAPCSDVGHLDLHISVCRSRGDGAMSELIVVTVIVAAEGGVKVPKITSREELTKALNKLGALRSEQVCLNLRVIFCAEGMYCVCHWQ